MTIALEFWILVHNHEGVTPGIRTYKMKDISEVRAYIEQYDQNISEEELKYKEIKIQSSNLIIICYYESGDEIRAEKITMEIS